MVRNHNPDGLRTAGSDSPWAPGADGPGCLEATIDHNGSARTLAWADQRTKTGCVVHPTLPAGPTLRIPARSFRVAWPRPSPERRIECPGLAESLLNARLRLAVARRP